MNTARVSFGDCVTLRPERSADERFDFIVPCICADFSCAVCQAAGHRRRYMLDSTAASAEGIYTVCLTYFSLICSLNSR